ncbi:hypothetical protein FQR65_LT07910 [Abscondita terminalis]|nr:hypothetical protein FQR65_LT07910 [Abscondita terminalis]
MVLKQFVLHYNLETKDVQMPTDLTIDELRNELFRQTGIHPSLQIIKEIPKSCGGNETIDRILPNLRSISISSKNEPEGIQSNNNESESTPKDVSFLACCNFINYLHDNYGNDYVSSLKTCSLEEALEDSCFAPYQFRKLLALYLHNEDDLFSKNFCSKLTNGKVRDVFERSFHILGWDLMSNRNGGLENIVNQWSPLRSIAELISTKQSALIILYPSENSFFVFTVVRGNYDMKELENFLHEIELRFNQEVKNTHQSRIVQQTNKSIGSREFQQMMFDQLGNRDYDSFEENQHVHLKNKIGFAKYGPPSANEYNEKQKKSIEKTYEKIKAFNNKFSKWRNRIVVSFIYNCLEPLDTERKRRAKKHPNYDPYTDIMPLPIFVIRKCKSEINPCRIFIDHDDRVYFTWSDYINNNKLHKCIMVLPKEGRYFGNENDEVMLEKLSSPSCSVAHAVLQGTDIATTATGIGAGCVFVAAAIPAITIAPIALTVAAITGAGVGVYGITRSAVKLADRAQHKETMSFLNSEARGAYLNIVAGSLGFVGAGATGLLSNLAARGINIGQVCILNNHGKFYSLLWQGARAAINVITVTNAGVSAASIANSTYDVFDSWIENGEVSPLAIVQLSSSILFFGNAVYNFRSANTIIEEAQVASLQKQRDLLSSNRQRKMLDKLLKETIRQTGNVQRSRAQVIATLSKYDNPKEVFSILSRNNKLFNRDGIKFAANDGKITLNGVAVDINELGVMTTSQKSQYFLDLPSTPATATVQELKSTFKFLKLF